MKTLLGVLALAFALTAGAASIDRYKTFLNGTQSARAHFEQKVYDRTGKLVQQSQGSFVFQRPGRFRWVYDKPADQVIVGDGQRVWIYDRQLNQVTVRKLAPALASSPGALAGGARRIGAALALSAAGEKGGLEWLQAK